MHLSRPSDEQIEDMIAHSFKNFHVKNFDYLCLKRTPEHTRKVYFFDGNMAQLPEVVNPHDHRYHFKTTVLRGKMSNSHYTLDNRGEVYQEFEWNTPLNGGDGFTWKQETRLLETTRDAYERGQTYFMKADEFHTIRMHADQTIIILDQYEDCVPVGKPTRTFMGSKKAPDMNGLYERFTADEVIQRWALFNSLST